LERRTRSDLLTAVVWEQTQDTPLGELLTPEQIAQLKRVM